MALCAKNSRNLLTHDGKSSKTNTSPKTKHDGGSLCSMRHSAASFGFLFFVHFTSRFGFSFLSRARFFSVFSWMSLDVLVTHCTNFADGTRSGRKIKVHILLFALRYCLRSRLLCFAWASRKSLNLRKKNLHLAIRRRYFSWCFFHIGRDEHFIGSTRIVNADSTTGFTSRLTTWTLTRRRATRQVLKEEISFSKPTAEFYGPYFPLKLPMPNRLDEKSKFMIFAA